MSSYKKNKREFTFTDCVLAFILIFSAGIIPAICRLTQRPVTSVESALRNSTVIWDTFSYKKSVFICVAAAAAVIMLFLEVVTETSSRKYNFKRPQFVIIGVYILTVIVSAVLSAYKPVSFQGVSERYEGMWVILSYIVLFMIAQVYISDKLKLNLVLGGFFLSAFIVGGIGMFQFFGMDIFKSQMGINLVLGEYKSEYTSLGINFSDVYSTLYNPNCAGLYSAMLAPFFIALAVFIPIHGTDGAQVKKTVIFRRSVKAVAAVLAIVMLINLIGSSSAGGLVGFAAAAFIAAVVFVLDMFINKKYKQKPVLYWGAFALILCVAAAATAFVCISPMVKGAVNAAVNGISQYPYTSLSVEKNKAVIETKNGELTAVYDKSTNDISLYNDGVLLEPDEKTKVEDYDNSKSYKYNGIALSDEITENMTLQYVKKDNALGLLVLTDAEKKDEKGAISFQFSVADNGELVPVSNKGRELTAEDAAKGMIFNGIPYFASGRGYIWSRSIPVALKHFIIGSGPDTFAFEFPQDDIFEKVKVFGNPYIIVDKPHCIYIQSAVNTGCISLIALICLFGYYIFKSIKSILSDRGLGYIKAVKIAAMAGVCGYLVAGMATDSVVSVAPVFWILLGTGFAADEM